MKSILIILLFFSLVFGNNQEEPKIKEGIKAIGHFEKFWKEKLIRNIKADPRGVKAVKYCSTHIYNETKRISNMYKGIELKRVSLRYRNPKDTPNEIDRKILKYFDRVKDWSREPKIKIIETKDAYRLYRPLVIVTPICLKCHGRANRIHPKVREIIDSKYPNDNAKNFRYMQVRGAIVATIKK